MTKLESESILHNIELGRVENGIVKNCLLVLEKANRDIKSEIRKTNGVYTKQRYKEIRKYLKDVSKELKKNVDDSMDVDEFLEYELKVQEKLFKKYGGLNLIAPTKEQVVSSATFAPYTSTSTFANYLDSLESDYFNMWDSQVRIGYMTGQTTQQIVKKVLGSLPQDAQVADMGLMHTLRNSVMMNTRTALQSFAMETRRMIYEKNEELFSGYRWVATLDRRTCIVCGNAENKFYKKLSDIDTPPLHPNCRCSVVPVIKDMEELEQEDTRASANGYVDAKITFEDWLQTQPVSVQKDVLGNARYEIFKNGGKLGGFVQDNKILTLAQLKN